MVQFPCVFSQNSWPRTRLRAILPRLFLFSLSLAFFIEATLIEHCALSVLFGVIYDSLGLFETPLNAGYLFL